MWQCKWAHGPWDTIFNWAQRKCCFHLASRLLQLVFQTPIFKIGNWGTLLLRLSASFWRASFWMWGLLVKIYWDLYDSHTLFTLTDILGNHYIEQIFERLLNLSTECNLHPKLQWKLITEVIFPDMSLVTNLWIIEQKISQKGWILIHIRSQIFPFIFS